MAEVDLNGTKFLLRPDPPKHGRVMMLMRTEKRGTDQDKVVAFLDFLEAMLDDTVDRDAFEQAVCDMDADELGAALKAAAESYKQDPTSAGRTPSSDFGGGSATGAATPRVVSFSRGTVQTEPSESLTG